MAFKWIEVYLESRPFEIDQTKISKEFVFIVTTDVDRDDQPYYTNGLPGTDLTVWTDDADVHREISYIFLSGGSFFPLFFEFEWFNGLPFLLWVNKISGTQLNWNQWKINVTFETIASNGTDQGGPNNDPEQNTENYSQLSFNTAFKEVNVPRSYLRESQGVSNVDPLNIAFPDGDNGISSLIPGQQRFVGVTDEKVEGADIVIRSFTFSITQYMNPAKLTAAYLRRLTRLVTCLNAVPFFGFPPLSVMCTGSNGSGHIYASVPVTLDFEVRPNFKFSRTLPTAIAPLEDTYTFDIHGTRVVDVSSAYNIYNEAEFMDTRIQNIAGITTYARLGGMGGGIIVDETVPVTPVYLPDGVHSGWSIVTYRFKEEVVKEAKATLKIPVERMIYLPDEYIPVDFVNFLL